MAIHCVGARQMARFFKRHRRGVPRREQRGMFNDKRLWEKTDEILFFSNIQIKYVSCTVKLHARLRPNCSGNLLTDSIYRLAGTCLRFKVAASLLSFELNGPV